MTLAIKFSALLAILPAAVPGAPVPVAGTTNYAQNFDSLGTTSPLWANDSTIPGWYAQINNGGTGTGNVQAADGTTVLNGLLNLGAAGSGERALGSKCTGSTANISCGVLFRNAGTTPVALSQVVYTGELWRTNAGSGTPVTPLAEEYTVFYQVSNSPITDIISGVNSPSAAAGAGFQALGAGADWVSPTNTPAGTALNGNAAANRTVVAFNPAGIMLAPGQYLMLKWTDANEANTDGFQGIDDVSIGFTGTGGLLIPEVSSGTRNASGTPLNPADDTFGFTLAVSASGEVGSGWTTTDVSSPNATGANYGVPVVWAGFPVAVPKTATLTDEGNPAFSTQIGVAPPRVIGVNALANANIITSGTNPPQWVIDESLLTVTMINGGGAPPKVITPVPVNLSGVSGVVKFSATMEAKDTSSGFEPADVFLAQLNLYDGVQTSVVNLITSYDTDASGMLQGTELAPGGGTPAAPTLRTFNFSHTIPDNIVSAQFVFSGNTDSSNETMTVRGIRFEDSPPSLQVIPGTYLTNHKGTDSAADDTYSQRVTVNPGNNEPSTGWTSNNPPPVGGLYAGPTLVTFGPFPVPQGSRVITITDNFYPAVQAQFTVTPPVPSLSVSAPANIVRQENGPGFADDTVTFDTTITSSAAGPRWTTTGATPDSGAYGAVTFTVPAAGPSLVLTITDVSYPAATQNMTVPLPGRYIFGRSNFGAGPADIVTPIGLPPSPAWINDPGLRLLDMTGAPGGGEKVVFSQVMDLTSVGALDFHAVFRARDTSPDTNFEMNDQFKLELIIDGTSRRVTVPYDIGDGANAVGTAGGPNGPPGNSINGYTGVAGTDVVTGTVYATGLDNYDANRGRDEFNRRGESGSALIDNLFPLTFTIPATANSVQIRISGIIDSPQEFFTVSELSLILSSLDSDGDGVKDIQEIKDGTDPANPASAFLITGVSPTGGIPGGANATFLTVSGRIYHGYFSTNLTNWFQDDTRGAITGDGSPAQWQLLPASPGSRRYLKILSGLHEEDFPAVLP